MSLKTRYTIPLLLQLALLLLSCQSGLAATATSIKAVLFYPAFCAECSAVIDDFLMPLSQEQGDKLELFPVDITEPPGDELFEVVLEHFGESPDAWSKPALLIGGELLRGKQEITTQLPDLLARELTSKLTHWPDLPGLQSLIHGEENPASPTTETESDPVATALAWTVMVFLLLSLGLTALRLVGTDRSRWAQCAIRSWILPLFALLGLGISLYLSAVTLSHEEIMCGPIGDCMGVQLSSYSHLFGIPMSVLGVVFYLGILILWTVQGRLDLSWSRQAGLGLLVFSVFGVIFSIYLTGLELFVIHAVCVWCLTSAILSSLIMLTVMLKITAECGTCD